MARLVKAGADVNAQGKDKRTPLLWAFPDNHLPRFKRLLEPGANPNVVVEGEFNTRQRITRGDSVTHMACDTSFAGYIEAVFDHGGDPHIRHTGPLGFHETPLFAVITGAAANKADTIRRPIDLGADMNAFSNGGTPMMQAMTWGPQYDVVIMMLDAGANFPTYGEEQVERL